MLEKCKHYYCHQIQEVRYLQSNGATVNTVHHDLALHFQGHKIWNVNISKTLSANKKCSGYDVYAGWYLPLNGPIANVVLHCFDLILQGQIFQMQISLKWLAKHASYIFYRFWYLPLNGAIPKVILCEFSLLLQSQIFQIVCNISEAIPAAQICQIRLL